MTGNKIAEGHLVCHGDVANGDAQAQHLLELELDGGLDLLNLQDIDSMSASCDMFSGQPAHL